MKDQLIYSRVTVQPSEEPVTVDELKDQLNIDRAYQQDGLYMQSKIKQAREWVELRIGQSIMSQTRVQTMDRFPKYDTIELLYGPVTSITSVKYYNENDIEQTADASSYWADLNRVVPRIVVKINWPSVGDRPGAVNITYVCGMTTVPQPIKDAILFLAAHFYQNRVPEVQGAIIGKVGFGVESLLGPYIVTQNSTYASW